MNFIKQLIKRIEIRNEMFSFIPGTYEREYIYIGSRIVERIIIYQLSELAEVYRIRKVICKYVSTEEKTVRVPKAEEWKASYDCSKRQLHEIAGQRSCAFIPEEKLLLIGDTGYFKVSSSEYMIF